MVAVNHHRIAYDVERSGAGIILRGADPVGNYQNALRTKEWWRWGWARAVIVCQGVFRALGSFSGWNQGDLSPTGDRARRDRCHR